MSGALPCCHRGKYDAISVVLDAELCADESESTATWTFDNAHALRLVSSITVGRILFQ